MAMSLSPVVGPDKLGVHAVRRPRAPGKALARARP